MGTMGLAGPVTGLLWCRCFHFPEKTIPSLSDYITSGPQPPVLVCESFGTVRESRSSSVTFVFFRVFIVNSVLLGLFLCVGNKSSFCGTGFILLSLSATP